MKKKTVKKIFKITLISLASLVGLALIGVCILLWIVFTPKRLTPIVENFAADYITCDYKIGEVELTFFSTFPQFGLKINEVRLVNHIANAPNDTLLNAQNVVAEINLRELISNNSLIINELTLNDIRLNAFVDTSGRTNFDVIKIEPAPEDDTAAFELPFDKIDLNTLKINDLDIAYCDMVNRINALIPDLDIVCTADLHNDDGNATLSLKGTSVDLQAGDLTASLPDIDLHCEAGLHNDNIEATLSLVGKGIDVIVDTVPYLTQADINVDLPLDFNRHDMRVALHNAGLSLNEFPVTVDGSVQLADNQDVNTDLSLALSKWQIKPLLGMLPPTMSSLLKGIVVDGIVDINGHLRGCVNDTTLPVLTVDVLYSDGRFEYVQLPYKLSDMVADVNVTLDVNSDTASFAKINRLKAKTGKNVITADGKVDNLLSDNPACNVNADLSVNVADIMPMLPKDMHLDIDGTTKVKAQAGFTMQQLTNADFDKMNIDAILDFFNITVDYDSLLVNADAAKMTVKIPNDDRQQPHFMRSNMQLTNLTVRQGNTLTANIPAAKLDIATSDITKGGEMSVACDFDFDKLTANTDSMSIGANNPKGNAFMQVNLNDTTAYPSITCDLRMTHLSGQLDTIDIDIVNPSTTIKLRSTESDKTKMFADMKFHGEKISAKMGKQLSISTDVITASGQAKEGRTSDNFLLHWNPELNIDLKNGEFVLPNFAERISIPSITFDYNNRKFIINDSRVVLGNSDFGLKGVVENIDKFIDKTGLLTGTLDFTSQYTDVNQLMDLTSGLGGSYDTVPPVPLPDKEVAPPADTESEPFLVPRRVDLTLNTRIGTAVVGQQRANNLGGRLYIKDGILILEEMGFICKAAKLQLTAMYKTPRPNHIFVGLDYHMLNIEIAELLKMFPDLLTMMPMFKSFEGRGEMHAVVETYMNSKYELKPSTLRGAVSIQGSDLILLNNEYFANIAKLLKFNAKSKNDIDSISAELTLFKKEVDIYPFEIKIGNFTAVVGGRHNFDIKPDLSFDANKDMNFSYHISLTQCPLPVRLGVDIGGSIDDLKIRLASCKYAERYHPKSKGVVDVQKLGLRQQIRDALKKNVKP